MKAETASHFGVVQTYIRSIWVDLVFGREQFSSTETDSSSSDYLFSQNQYSLPNISI
jgi:hypothetical protein